FHMRYTRVFPGVTAAQGCCVIEESRLARTSQLLLLRPRRTPCRLPQAGLTETTVRGLRVWLICNRRRKPGRLVAAGAQAAGMVFSSRTVAGRSKRSNLPHDRDVL